MPWILCKGWNWFVSFFFVFFDYARKSSSSSSYELAPHLSDDRDSSEPVTIPTFKQGNITNGCLQGISLKEEDTQPKFLKKNILVTDSTLMKNYRINCLGFFCPFTVHSMLGLYAWLDLNSYNRVSVSVLCLNVLWGFCYEVKKDKFQIVYPVWWFWVACLAVFSYGEGDRNSSGSGMSNTGMKYCEVQLEWEVWYRYEILWMIVRVKCLL